MTVNLEEIAYECPSVVHEDNKPKLERFKYLNGSISSYGLCNKCNIFYEITDSGVIRLDEGLVDKMPFLYDMEGHQIDPVDLSED